MSTIVAAEASSEARDFERKKRLNATLSRYCVARSQDDDDTDEM